MARRPVRAKGRPGREAWCFRVLEKRRLRRRDSRARCGRRKRQVWMTRSPKFGGRAEAADNARLPPPARSLLQTLAMPSANSPSKIDVLGQSATQSTGPRSSGRRHLVPALILVGRDIRRILICTSPKAGAWASPSPRYCRLALFPGTHLPVVRSHRRASVAR